MKEELIFHEALALCLPEERAAYLDRACAGDRALRQSIESLLKANEGAGGFLSRPAPALRARPDQPIREGPGTIVGSYKLLEAIGEGGMGVVYMAEQTEPMRRTVALKVIKPGMDTKQVIARFEAERQALALMDHPNIARILDAGATGSGHPYFVMELANGIPITDYCERNHLSIADRLDLFVLVCQAVQHAHLKGIIHRDLKPTNVLITLHDGTPVPKVIDFGIAKATGQQTLTDKTLYTGIAELLGTPMYLSPEQAELSGIDVDTRSDIYSLGVLLYELLTGTTPFDHDTFRIAALDEVRRIIREEDPQPPSTRYKSLTQTGTNARAKGRAGSRKLSHLLRNKLDWITMRAWRKTAAIAMRRPAPSRPTSCGTAGTSRSKPALPRPGIGRAGSPGAIGWD
jgi:serine/threonine protein kinase